MHENQQDTARNRTFITVWAVLLLLTGLTVAAAELQMGRWSIVLNLLIASGKAGLVIWFFMHLKYERLLFKLLLLVPIATITIIIWLTFYDIWYR